MFTGIIQSLGKVDSLSDGVLFVTPSADFAPEGFEVGESIAVNGCCLTVTPNDGSLRFDLSPETMERTSLGDLEIGSKVNLERAMQIESRFGGHIVQGHVDSTATILAITPSDNSIIFRFQIQREDDRYLIDKGSVCLDGISLTIVDPVDGQFDVWVIPHTLENTNLGDRKVGDRVNLEFDVLAKHVEKLLLSFAGRLNESTQTPPLPTSLKSLIQTERELG